MSSDLGFSDLFDVLSDFCTKHEQTLRQEAPACDDLGDFDSVWRYLSSPPPASTNGPPVGIDLLDDSTTSVSSKVRRQFRKREARLNKRRLGHELRESQVLEALDVPPPLLEDVPELGDYTSASDLDMTGAPSEDESAKEERMVELRDSLSAMTEQFLGSRSTPKRVRPSARERTLSAHRKLAAAFPAEPGLLSCTSAALPATQRLPAIAFKEKVSDRQIGDGPAIDQTHIFIDSSNIFLGFQDLLQKLHPSSYPQFSHRKPVMDLHILDTILERGRTSPAKFLVGSAPLLQSWDSMTSRNYEVSILERVSSQSRPTSKREQGVDELIHMKMLYSIVDSPPSTMVLATGDANVAQFSAGFFDIVLKALSRGWKVEVVAFRSSLNKLWLDRKFRDANKGTFSVYFLDDYIDELES